MHASLLNLVALPALAAAATHSVMVGDGGLKFVPETVTAAVGDTVEFTWASGGHSVTQGDKSNACMPSGSNAFNSGDIEKKGEVWSLKITSTDPIYYYCGVNMHCQGGMVGGINVPSADIASYKSAASSANQNVLPSVVQGGTLGSASSGSGSSSSSNASPSPTPASSSSTVASSNTMASSNTSSQASSAPAPSSGTMSSSASNGATTPSPSSSGSGSGMAQNATSSTASGSGAAATEMVGALLVGLPAAVMAFL